MFKKLGFETATYPPFRTMSWNILLFFFWRRPLLRKVGYIQISNKNKKREWDGIVWEEENKYFQSDCFWIIHWFPHTTWRASFGAQLCVYYEFLYQWINSWKLVVTEQGGISQTLYIKYFKFLNILICQLHWL